MPRFYDLTTGDYSAHNTIDGLFEMLAMDFCECGEGYDMLDSKDGQRKCLNCWRMNNMESVSEATKREYIELYEYRIEEDLPEQEEE